ncbi:MAG: OsmC family protein [Microthrixaceae bacterium]|nr:OsmC family protein [Microthrixaceae bacterium]
MTTTDTLTSPLRPLIDATVDAVTSNPQAAQVVFRADHDLVGTTEVAVKFGSGHRITVDEPAALGGGNVAANPIEYALASLGSCNAITYQYWAAQLDLRFDHVKVEVEADLDVRGFFGADPNTRPGPGAVRVTATIDGPESDDDYRRLAEAVENHCPVLDLFRNTTPVNNNLVIKANS